MAIIPDRLLEQYLILLLDARVKFCMTQVELEVPGTYERYLKLSYFYKKANLFLEFVEVNSLKGTDKMKLNAWYRLILAWDTVEEQYAAFKPYWTII